MKHLFLLILFGFFGINLMAKDILVERGFEEPLSGYVLEYIDDYNPKTEKYPYLSLLLVKSGGQFCQLRIPLPISISDNFDYYLRY